MKSRIDRAHLSLLTFPYILWQWRSCLLRWLYQSYIWFASVSAHCGSRRTLFQHKVPMLRPSGYLCVLSMKRCNLYFYNNFSKTELILIIPALISELRKKTELNIIAPPPISAAVNLHFHLHSEFHWVFLFILGDFDWKKISLFRHGNTRSSATAEKQRVSCTYGGG